MKLSFGFLLLLSVTLCFSFVYPKHKRNYVTYVYVGPCSLGSQRDAANYFKGDATSSGPPEKICTITAEDNGDHPDFSSSNPVDFPVQFTPITKQACQ